MSLHAESIGPLPYRSLADSPFKLGGLGSTFFVDDFSKPIGVFYRELPPYGLRFPFAKLSTPGVEISGTVGWTGTSIGTVGGCTDSIPPSCFSGLSFQFDSTELGFLPQAVGFSVSGIGRFSLSAYDAQGVLEEATTVEPDLSGYVFDPPPGEIIAVSPPPSVFVGEIYTGGISRISIGSNQVMFAMDDFQYGQLVPEPATMCLAAVALCLVAKRRGRTR